MDKTFTEENGMYKIDCSKALWATDEMHSQCQIAKCYMSDVDWIIETKEKIVMVEYKNANISEAKKPETFNPKEDKVITKLVKKFYDSVHYLTLLGKGKPREYVCILEYPNGDSTSRRMIRNRMKVRLPFVLQDTVGDGKRLIEKVEVLSIDEWNNDEEYGIFPILPCE